MVEHRLLAAQASPLTLGLVPSHCISRSASIVVGARQASAVAAPAGLHAQHSAFEADVRARVLAATSNATTQRGTMPLFLSPRATAGHNPT